MFYGKKLVLSLLVFLSSGFVSAKPKRVKYREALAEALAEQLPLVDTPSFLVSEEANTLLDQAPLAIELVMDDSQDGSDFSLNDSQCSAEDLFEPAEQIIEQDLIIAADQDYLAYLDELYNQDAEPSVDWNNASSDESSASFAQMGSNNSSSSEFTASELSLADSSQELVAPADDQIAPAEDQAAFSNDQITQTPEAPAVNQDAATETQSTPAANVEPNTDDDEAITRTDLLSTLFNGLMVIYEEVISFITQAQTHVNQPNHQINPVAAQVGALATLQSNTLLNAFITQPVAAVVGAEVGTITTDVADYLIDQIGLCKAAVNDVTKYGVQVVDGKMVIVFPSPVQDSKQVTWKISDKTGDNGNSYLSVTGIIMVTPEIAFQVNYDFSKPSHLSLNYDSATYNYDQEGYVVISIDLGRMANQSAIAEVAPAACKMQVLKAQTQ